MNPYPKFYLEFTPENGSLVGWTVRAWSPRIYANQGVYTVNIYLPKGQCSKILLIIGEVIKYRQVFIHQDMMETLGQMEILENVIHE